MFRKICLGAICAIALVLIIFAIKIIPGTLKANKNKDLKADTLLVLGGGIKREMLAADLLSKDKDLSVIISTGSSIPCLYRVFVKEKKIEWKRVLPNFKATDTLSNFTSILPIFKRLETKKVKVIATNGHWKRAKHLAQIVLHSNGINFEAELIDGQGHEESTLKTKLDIARAYLWLLFGEIIIKNDYNNITYLDEKWSERKSNCEIGSAKLPDWFYPSSPLKDSESLEDPKLIHALKTGDDLLFSVLISNKELINQTDKNGKSAIFYAIEQDNGRKVFELYKAEANFSITDNQGKRPLDYIKKNGNVENFLGQDTLIEIKSKNLNNEDFLEQSPIQIISKKFVRDKKTKKLKYVIVELENHGSETLHEIELIAKFEKAIYQLNGPNKLEPKEKSLYSKTFPKENHENDGEIIVKCKNCY